METVGATVGTRGVPIGVGVAVAAGNATKSFFVEFKLSNLV